MKLALGTAQFGQKYGLANRTGHLDRKMVEDILSIARMHNIDTLDTAISYGDSESLLGEVGVSDFKVISKLPALPDMNELSYSEVATWIKDHINQSLRRLRCESLGGLLFHHADDLFTSRGKKAWEVLEDMKREHLVDSLGVSVYTPDELNRLEKEFDIQSVQCPLNVFDRRFDKLGLIHRLSSDGVTIFVRSVFLQGLLLMPKERRPAYFKKWDNELSRWDTWTQNHTNTSIALQAALGYICSVAGIHRILVGVDSPKHLLEIIDALRETNEFPDWDFSHLTGLIDPREWK